ncbi:MAG: 4,5-DOPA dioxygenase extradiol [Veillonella sp. oral taxon 158]|uniref:4,5-DOPA-extradiol-dioxygenase n=1 Tax=Veillonella sp. oral taxon 158 TaxID=671228 RepID=UPI002354FF6B|nr:4,5-DOPA dioxygenase extradiol [Veillonella sp. oral taxon 158]MBS6449461.1 4,5-DOPA dioxygenase extradiol [Veillonella sp. oral taxon 158]
MKRMPTLFVGHGSPMMALEHTETTNAFQTIGKNIINNYGKPKAILAISAHWYADGTYIQSAENPKQIYDMYGFPQELYEVVYPAKGDSNLTKEVQKLLDNSVSINDTWGIDHGTWTVLVHMFPDASIPVVQLSINKYLSPKEMYQLGTKLQVLRDEGYLIIGSGNIVHNLSRLEWENPLGSPATIEFDQYISNAVLENDVNTVINYSNHPQASYAVPTPDHYVPLLYIMGASEGLHPTVFNQTYNSGSLSMTGFIFQDDPLNPI